MSSVGAAIASLPIPQFTPTEAGQQISRNSSEISGYLREKEMVPRRGN